MRQCIKIFIRQRAHCESPVKDSFFQTNRLQNASLIGEKSLPANRKMRANFWAFLSFSSCFRSRRSKLWCRSLILKARDSKGWHFLRKMYCIMRSGCSLITLWRFLFYFTKQVPLGVVFVFSVLLISNKFTAVQTNFDSGSVEEGRKFENCCYKMYLFQNLDASVCLIRTARQTDRHAHAHIFTPTHSS